MTDQLPQDDEGRALLQKEGAQGLGELFARHRDRLRGMVRLRIDLRVIGRVDPSDVIQEAFVEAQNRLGDYLNDPKMSPFLWIRFLTVQQLMIVHRRHLDTKKRDARREVSIDKPLGPGASSVNIAEWIIASQSTPSKAIQRAERQAKLQKALEQMDDTDREVLALRHFEQLEMSDVAVVMGLSASTASQRHYRALKKLKEILTDLFGDDLKS